MTIRDQMKAGVTRLEPTAQDYARAKSVASMFDEATQQAGRKLEQALKEWRQHWPSAEIRVKSVFDVGAAWVVQDWSLDPPLSCSKGTYLPRKLTPTKARKIVGAMLDECIAAARSLPG